MDSNSKAIIREYKSRLYDLNRRRIQVEQDYMKKRDLYYCFTLDKCLVYGLAIILFIYAIS